MSLNFTQYDDKWRIQIDEKWEVDSLKEATKVFLNLLELKDKYGKVKGG